MRSSKKLSKLSNKDTRPGGAIQRLLTRSVTEVFDREHLKKALSSARKLRVKFGIDPTGPKIHLGRAIPLRKLREFQDLGHTAVLIVGDFTAQVGDPSDKLSKRPMLTQAEIKKNLKDYKKQLGKIVDLSKAEVHFNSAWLKKLSFQEIATLAESFSIQQMLERRNFKERFEKHEEISLREFLYPLMQGYDSVAVKADVEIGGFDQLFNLMAGRTIQRHYGQMQQDVLTCAMLEGTDGRKMSTSWGNVITIVDEPNDMFGKIMSLRDELIGKYFLLCTDLEEGEIHRLENDIDSKQINPRDAKLLLAREIVALYHGEKAAAAAEKEFEKVFQKKELPTNVQVVRLPQGHIPVADLLVAANLAASMSVARRLVAQGGVKVGGYRVTDPKHQVTVSREGILVQVGKRRFVEVRSHD